jgi:AmiR/NasT family two-component response regulator
VTRDVETSATINQAVGVVMDRRRCTAEAALAILTQTATARGQDLPTAAQALLDGRPLIDERD